MLEIDAQQLASILEMNRETLVSGEMVEKGSTQEEAAASMDTLIAAVRLADYAKLALRTENNRTLAELELKLQLP